MMSSLYYSAFGDKLAYEANAQQQLLASNTYTNNRHAEILRDGVEKKWSHEHHLDKPEKPKQKKELDSLIAHYYKAR